MPRFLKPFMQGPLRERVKEGMRTSTRGTAAERCAARRLGGALRRPVAFSIFRVALPTGRAVASVLPRQDSHDVRALCLQPYLGEQRPIFPGHLPIAFLHAGRRAFSGSGRFTIFRTTVCSTLNRGRKGYQAAAAGRSASSRHPHARRQRRCGVATRRQLGQQPGIRPQRSTNTPLLGFFMGTSVG